MIRLSIVWGRRSTAGNVSANQSSQYPKTSTNAKKEDMDIIWVPPSALVGFCNLEFNAVFLSDILTALSGSQIRLVHCVARLPEGVFLKYYFSPKHFLVS